MSPAANHASINNFSDKLNEIIEENLPKEGQPLIFKLLFTPTKQEAINEGDVRVDFQASPRGLRMLLLETIIDPGTNKPIQIANLKGWAPNPNGPQQPIIGEINFSNSGNNIITVGENDPVLAARLLLSNKNRDCINPRKQMPEGGYLFEMLKPAADAESEYDKKMALGEALSIVRTLENDEDLLASIVDKLNIAKVDGGRKLTEKELLLKVSLVAEGDPERLTNLVEAGETKLEQLIAKAEKLGVIVFVEEAQQWRYKATQEPITEAVQGYKPAEALVRYIQGNANGTNFSRTLAGRVKQEEATAKKGGKKAVAETPAE